MFQQSHVTPIIFRPKVLCCLISRRAINGSRRHQLVVRLLSLPTHRFTRTHVDSCFLRLAHRLWPNGSQKFVGCAMNSSTTWAISTPSMQQCNMHRTFLCMSLHACLACRWKTAITSVKPCTWCSKKLVQSLVSDRAHSKNLMHIWECMYAITSKTRRMTSSAFC